MPVTIGDFTTDVIADRGADAAPAASGGAGDEQSAAPVRAQLAAILRDDKRTRAEGFDD